MFDWTENYYNKNENLSRELTDLDYNFGVHPLSKDVRKKTNIEAIKQSIRTLVLLNHYEKPFHPDIGCDIYKSLFELMSVKVNEHIVRNQINELIDSYEPRVDIQDIQIEFNRDQNEMNITIIFIPVGYTSTERLDIFLKILR